jgi:NAD-dependent DNA ligase
MRRYILKPGNISVEKWDWKSNNYTERKVFDVLTGISLGILADGELSAKEASFLAKWIEINAQILPEKFIRKLLPVIRVAGHGGELSDDDLASITILLESIAFGEKPNNSSNTAPLIGTPCALIFDDIDSSQILLRGCEFVFTGNFMHGSKKDLMERTNKLGASAKSANPTSRTDYVVVGSEGSEQWAYSGLGRKVEHALKLKSESCKLKIIREDDFFRVLENYEKI